MRKNLDLSVAILAAGLGTRMKSRQAKVLHCAGGRTLIEHVVAAAVRLVPPERVLVVVGHQAGDVKRAVLSVPCFQRVRFVHQARQLGTGHALMAARRQLEHSAQNLLVLYGDAPLLGEATLRGLIEAHLDSGAACTLLTTELDDPTGYGRIIRDRDAGGPNQGKLIEIVEEKACTAAQAAIKEINPGIYCFRTRLLFEHIRRLDRNNPSREFYLTDMAGVLRRAGRRVETRSVMPPEELLGINTRAELAAMDSRLRGRKAQELMQAGVTILRPETCAIDPQVEIGADSVIGPCVALYGTTRIGENCTVKPFSTLRDSVLENEVAVEECCWLEGARVARGARIGPFARLRAGTEIGPEAHIGSFVETKKIRMGRGAKAMHLSYLGDAVIGKDVNIGAGAVTCNYDGEKKNRTVIEDGAFVGTNSSLVAPVKVGKGAYVAAGSTITANVPSGALGLGRARQENKKGWVAGRKKQERRKKRTNGKVSRSWRPG